MVDSGLCGCIVVDMPTRRKNTKQPAVEHRQQLSVRLPPAMLHALRDDAEKNGRTINGSVTVALREYLERVGS